MLGDLTMMPFPNTLPRYWGGNKEFTAILKISSLNILWWQNKVRTLNFQKYAHLKETPEVSEHFPGTCLSTTQEPAAQSSLILLPLAVDLQVTAPHSAGCEPQMTQRQGRDQARTFKNWQQSGSDIKSLITHYSKSLKTQTHFVLFRSHSLVPSALLSLSLFFSPA